MMGISLPGNDMEEAGEAKEEGDGGVDDGGGPTAKKTSYHHNNCHTPPLLQAKP